MEEAVNMHALRPAQERHRNLTLVFSASSLNLPGRAMIANRLIIFVSILLLVLVVIIILTDFLVFLALLVVFFTQFCIILGLFIGFIIIFLFSTLILYVLRLRFEFFLLLRLLLTAFSVCSIQSQILAFGSCCR